MLRAFIRDSAIYAIPTFITRGFALFLVPIYTRVLSPADYGSLDLLLAFANLANLTVALEISQGVARFYAEQADGDRRVAYVSSAFWFTLFCYTVFGTVALVNSHELAAYVMGRGGQVKAFQIGILYIWLNGIFYLVQNQFRWELRSKQYAMVSVLVAVITAGVAVWLTYGVRWGLEGMLLGMAAGAAVGVVYGLWHLRGSVQFRFDGARLREMLVFSAPLVPSGIAVFISTYVDRLLINHFLSVDDVGLYGIGFRLAGIVGLVMVGFQGALTPLVYTHYGEPETPGHLARIFRVFTAFALLVFLVLSLFARDILVLMTTPAYYSAAPLVTYLVPAILLSQMYIFAPGIGIAKRTYLILWVNLGGAILNTFLSWFLIPALGIRGAGLASLLGYLCVFTAYMVFSQRLYHVPHAWARLGAAAAVAAVLATWLPGLDLGTTARWIANIIALGAMALMIVAMGLIRPSEIRQIANRERA